MAHNTNAPQGTIQAGDAATNAERGIHYADGGVTTSRVFYPDPNRVEEIHAEWAASERGSQPYE